MFLSNLENGTLLSGKYQKEGNRCQRPNHINHILLDQYQEMQIVV